MESVPFACDIVVGTKGSPTISSSFAISAIYSFFFSISFVIFSWCFNAIRWKSAIKFACTSSAFAFSNFQNPGPFQSRLALSTWRSYSFVACSLHSCSILAVAMASSSSVHFWNFSIIFYICNMAFWDLFRSVSISWPIYVCATTITSFFFLLVAACVVLGLPS